MASKSRKRGLPELQAEFKNAFSPALNEKGRIDAERLRGVNRPLSEVFDSIVSSKTTRDDPQAVAKELARLIAARDESTDLAKAISTLETKMARQLNVERAAKKVAKAGTSRRSRTPPTSKKTGPTKKRGK